MKQISKQMLDDSFQNAKILYSNKEHEKSNNILFELLKICKDTSLQATIALNYLSLKNYQLAFDFANEALDINPNDVFLNCLLGDIYFSKEDVQNAILIYKKALNYDLRDENIYNRLANCYFKLNDNTSFRVYLQNSLSINNKQEEVLKRLAYLEGQELQYDKAIHYYRFLLSFCDSPDIYHLLGIAYTNTYEYKKAIYYFHKSLDSFAKTNSEALHKCLYNLGVSYHKLGYYDEAKKAYLHFIAHNPNDPKTQWALASLYLLLGDFKNGWKKYEWRKKMPIFSKRTHGLLEGVPEYKGESLDGKILSVQSEQGFGDNIQFTKCMIMLLNTTNVKKIIFRVHTVLYKLLCQLSSERCEVYPEGYKYVANVKADYQITLMSLPIYLDLSLMNMDNKPYLQSYKKVPLALDTNKLNIGIAWSGNSENANNTLRSISLNSFDDILRNEEINFYSLHIDDINNDIEKFGYENKIINISSKIKDFEDTASIINQLDLIISVDTVIAHLASSLGKKTYLLLQYSPDFRWLLDRNDSPWYESMTIFRQEEFNDYLKPIEKIKDKIENMVYKKREEYKQIS